jgi:hypothetical protein
LSASARRSDFQLAAGGGCRQSAKNGHTRTSVCRRTSQLVHSGVEERRRAIALQAETLTCQPQGGCPSARTGRSWLIGTSARHSCSGRDGLRQNAAPSPARRPSGASASSASATT